MSTSKMLVFLAMALCLQCACTVCSAKVVDCIKQTKSVVYILLKVRTMINSDVELSELPKKFFESKQKELLGNFDKIHNQLNDLESKIDLIASQSLTTKLHNIHETFRLEMRLHDLLDYRARINAGYDRMTKYALHQHAYEQSTLEDFARTVISHDPNSIVHLLERMHSFVVPSGNGITDTGLFKLLESYLKEAEGDMMCDTKQSPQQVLYNLYDAIVLTELKGFTMVQFSYMILRLYGRGNFTKESELSQEKFQERMNSVVFTVKNVMKNVSRELWNCDPEIYTKGETYEEITNFLQGYIQNEIDLNSEGTCREDCAEYTYTKNHGCHENDHCMRQRNCNGRIVSCQFFDSDMWICNANPRTGRRYEYIEYENGKILGKKQSCPRKLDKVDSFWRWFIWSCSYCFCLCDEHGIMSDRYINMRSVLSDIKNNKVVTGLRFVKKNRIIHLQIQEGELLPGLNVNASSVTWKPVEDYKITDRKVFNGQDFHTLTWEKRALDLDDLEADDGYVMTGVRFKEIGTHLNFEIYTTKFDFDTGKLKPEHSTWKDNPNTEISRKNPRTKVSLTQPDIPTKTTASSVPTSKTNQFIEFTHSDIEKDAAQTAVPFLDAQKLESVRAVPLSGAGIFHKGRPYFGGFITPRIITYDVSKYLNAAFP
ncbi:uncharacterized protein LOC115884266 [Sitophilus oryzae]|uniref:Uncharacterized protein LOC115884266 n=1 Tax=Sitophilus oryzae TaxID=7048 RepID=A0A6J2Y4A9_SITOR|nr:uncharacterized protein LOC115884266 [Sitophilus oryzae]